MNRQTPFFRDLELLIMVPTFKISFLFLKDLTSDRPNIGQILLFNLSPARRHLLAYFQYRKQHIAA